MSRPIAIIPARMASTRLPGKPLADIAGEPMIVHVWRRACAARIGPVIVAVDCSDIAQAIERAGGQAILTDPDLPSGSDRVHQAVERFDPNGLYDVVVNIQGDLPTIDPACIRASLDPLVSPEVDIATLAAVISRPEEAEDPNVVKLVGAPISERRVRALYFTRARAPWGEGPLLHHIGLYAWRRSALRKFVAEPPSTLERRERLEQLRALESGLRIDAAIVEDTPLGVDAPEDLARARAIIHQAHTAIQRTQ